MSIVDSVTFALAQINLLVSSLNKKNYKSNIAEIAQLVSQYQPDAERHLLRCLFSAVDFSAGVIDKSNSSDYYKVQYLTQEVIANIARPHFVSLLCNAIECPLRHQNNLKPSSSFFSQISKVLKLNCVQEVVFGIALLKSSNVEISAFAGQWVKQKLPDLLHSYVNADNPAGQEGGGLNESSIEILHLLLSHIQENKRDLDISDELIENFLKTLRKDFPKERVPLVLSPLLYPVSNDLQPNKLFRETPSASNMQNDDNIAEILEELGYNCTSSEDEMRNALSNFNVSDLSPSAIAQCICMFMRTCDGQLGHQITLQQPSSASHSGSSAWKSSSGDSKPASDSFNWCVENFIKITQEKNPSLNFRQVVADLDCPQFKLTSRNSFMVFKQCVFRGLNDTLPIELFYQPWKNPTAQLSLFQHFLKYSDVICLAYWPHRSADLSKLKYSQEDDRVGQIWKNIDFVDGLLRLHDSGLSSEIQEMFAQAFEKCPDVLLFTLLQTSINNVLKEKICFHLLSHFLNNPSTNANVIFQVVWSTESSSYRYMVIKSLVDYYTTREQQPNYSSVPRILEIVTDLKIELNFLLSHLPIKMAIDLAVYSHKKEILKLEKWLTDKMERDPDFSIKLYDYLKDRISEDPKCIPPDLALDKNTLKIFLVCLLQPNNASRLPPEKLNFLSHILQTLSSQSSSQTNRTPSAPGPPGAPGLLNLGGLSGPTSAAPGPVSTNMQSHLSGSVAPGMNRPQQAPIGSGLTKSNAPNRLDNLQPIGSSSYKQHSFQAAPGSSQHSALQPANASNNPRYQQQNLQQSQFSGFNVSSSSMQGFQKFGNSGSSMIDLPMNPWTQQSLITQSNMGDMHLKASNADLQTSMPFGLAKEFDGDVGKDVENEVNNCITKVFSQNLSVKEVISNLQDYVREGKPNHAKFLHGMVNVILDEFQHHLKDYPEPHLKLLADLFSGLLIANNLLPSILTQEMWNRVIRKFYQLGNSAATDPNYFTAIVCILQHCKPILNRWPQIAVHLQKSPVFSKLPLDIQETFFAIQKQFTTDPMTKMSSDVHNAMQNMSIEPSDSIQQSHQIEAKPLDPPSEAVVDRVYFCFNNVSKLNVKEKSAELAETVPEEYVPWLAQYIVVKRVTTEPNFHELFVQLVDNLQDKMPSLRDKIMQELFRNIKALLRNMKPDLQDFNDRTLLKNLGHFLGLITLGKNKPILHDDINFKDLLFEAFHKSAIEMHYVVPFVARTMEGAADSVVFKPPNPWTMGLLKVLKELHGESTVRLNLKFEVEILCKRLEFDFNSLEPAYFLRDDSYQSKIESQLCFVVSNQERQAGHLPPLGKQSNLPSSSVGVSMSNESSVFSQSDMMMQDTHPALKQTLGNESIISSQPSDVSMYGLMPSVMQSQMQPCLPSSKAAPGHVSTTPPQPHAKLRYSDINLNDLSSHLVINENLELFNAYPAIKNMVRPSIERTVMELTSPVFDRCSRITLTTVEHMVRKDFALDSDEKRMKSCAHSAVRFLTAGMSLMTAREALGISLVTGLKNMVLGAIRTASAAQREMVENMANQVVNENMDICLAFMQKTIAERTIVEIDKRLANDYAARKDTRNYYDANVVQYQQQNMPEQLRKQIGGPSQTELSVYHEFQKMIPGFAPGVMDMMAVSSGVQAPLHHSSFPGSSASQMSMHPSSMVTSGSQMPSNVQSISSQPNDTTTLGSIYDKMIKDIEHHLTCISHIIRTPSDPKVHSLRCLIDVAHLAKTRTDPMAASSVVAKTVQSFMENYSTKTRDQPHGLEIVERFKEAHMVALRHMLPYDQAPYGYAWVTKHVTTTWKQIEEPNANLQTGKWNSEAMAELLKVHVINLGIMDEYLADEIKIGKSSALIFVLDLFDQFIIGDKREFTVLNEYDMYTTIEAMYFVLYQASNIYDSNNELLLRLEKSYKGIKKHLDLGLLANHQNPDTNYLYAGCSQAREFDDPSSLQEQSEVLMRRWLEIYMSKYQKDQNTFENYFQQMKKSTVLQDDGMITRFLRLATVFVVERSHTKLKQESGVPHARLSSYTELDAYARLVSLLVKYEKGQKKISLLNKALGIIAGTLLQEHEVRQEWFHPMPFHRILIMLFLELNSTEDNVMVPYQNKVLTAFCNVLHVLRPCRASSFVYSWLEIVSHRTFIARMFSEPQSSQELKPMYAQLIVDLLKYIRFYLMNAILNKPITVLYKGTLRYLLVLWHDFPEFIINFHSLFCDVIPTNSLQLRNLIVSASPKSISSTALQDPLNAPPPPENLTQIEDPIGYCMDAGDRIIPISLKQELDSYLGTRTPVKFLSELVTRLKSDEDPSFNYDVELMNSLVLYLCISAIKSLRERGFSLSSATIAHTAQMDIIQSLVLNMDNEGRYLLLNAMANQLRYPNSHTFYFSHTILYLFSEQSKDHVKEQITRVLLERLIVNRPHPWGLLMTFGELLRNPIYKFWDNEFVRCAPEIETVLETVARSCIPNFKLPPYPTTSGQNALLAQQQQSSTQQQLSNGAAN